MNGTNLTKKSFTWHNEEYFLLGKDKDGCSWYLQNPTHNLYGTYWIYSFTNSKSPEKSKDIKGCIHYDSPLLDRLNKFFEFFVESPFTEEEVWLLKDLMESLYITKEYSTFLRRGSANILSLNPCAEIIKNEGEYKRLNEIVIPTMLDEVRKLLKGEIK